MNLVVIIHLLSWSLPYVSPVHTTFSGENDNLFLVFWRRFKLKRLKTERYEKDKNEYGAFKDYNGGVNGFKHAHYSRGQPSWREQAQKNIYSRRRDAFIYLYIFFGLLVVQFKTYFWLFFFSNYNRRSEKVVITSFIKKQTEIVPPPECMCGSLPPPTDRSYVPQRVSGMCAVLEKRRIDGALD